MDEEKGEDENRIILLKHSQRNLMFLCVKIIAITVKSNQCISWAEVIIVDLLGDKQENTEKPCKSEQ